MKHRLMLIAISVCLSVTSCEKDYLDKKPDKALLVPTKLSDMKALLENFSEVFSRVPALHNIASDDFYTTDAGLAAYSTAGERNSYIWAEDIFEGASSNDWAIPYKQVFVANVVLEGLEKLSMNEENAVLMSQIRGTALFQRAFAFYNLAQSFSAPYESSAAGRKAGIPIRLSSNVNLKPSRGTIEQTYARILTDLTEAEDLLPPKGRFSNQPGKDAARALLAKVHLLMGNYKKAQEYAELSLQIRNDLIDYNTLNPLAARTLPSSIPSASTAGNKEVVFYAIAVSYSFASSASTLVDLTLFDSYANNDLRKAVYFNNKGNRIVNFKGNYSGNASLFAGLTTSEVYLIRAECAARNGDRTLAMNVLNTLLEKRWKKGTFLPLTADTPDQALLLILQERRKELIARGTRWSDLRRLNQDPRFAVTLKREMKDNTYSLVPGGVRYIFPIPHEEIQLGGIEQNAR
jgi:tetratricopeptide (TPR) repeat protein